MNKNLSLILILLSVLFMCCSSTGTNSDIGPWTKIENLFPDEVDGIKKQKSRIGHNVSFINEEGKGISSITFGEDGSITWVSDEGKNYDNGIPPSYAGWTAGTFYDDWPFIFYGTAPHYIDLYLNETKKWKNGENRMELNS